MKSLEERYEETIEDPKKLKRFFTLTWVVAYGMLILGFIIILWVFLKGRSKHLNPFSTRPLRGPAVIPSSHRCQSFVRGTAR